MATIVFTRKLVVEEVAIALTAAERTTLDEIITAAHETAGAGTAIIVSERPANEPERQVVTVLADSRTRSKLRRLLLQRHDPSIPPHPICRPGTNNWALYGNGPAAVRVSEEIDAAFSAAMRSLDANLAAGADPIAAAEQAFAEMTSVLMSFDRLGASDTAVRELLHQRIAAHLRGEAIQDPASDIAAPAT